VSKDNTLSHCGYGVATVSRLLKIIGLFCRILSLLYGSFAKEPCNFKELTNRSHPIPCGCSESDVKSTLTEYVKTEDVTTEHLQSMCRQSVSRQRVECLRILCESIQSVSIVCQYRVCQSMCRQSLSVSVDIHLFWIVGLC